MYQCLIFHKKNLKSDKNEMNKTEYLYTHSPASGMFYRPDRPPGNPLNGRSA